MRTEQAEYSIGDLSRLYGVSLRTLRFYEDRALLRPCRVQAQRVYTDRERVTLEVILLGKRLGFSLAEIAELLDANEARAPVLPASMASLGLSRTQIGDQISKLSEERARIQAAIEELRSTALGANGKFS